MKSFNYLAISIISCISSSCSWEEEEEEEEEEESESNISIKAYERTNNPKNFKKPFPFFLGLLSAVFFWN